MRENHSCCTHGFLSPCPARGRIEVEGNAAWEWVLSSTLTVTLAIPIGVPLEGPQETDERS